jgi:tripartite-type tricarboxylate transporter receptor subunit TctC
MRMWVAALAMSCALPAGVTAQGSYPARPVTIVVPASPGGVTDMLGRTLAQRFTEAWGQQALTRLRGFDSKFENRCALSA